MLAVKDQLDLYSLEAHEFSTAFPLVEGEKFDELCQSISQNGLIDRITLWNGQILDGRNRYRACLAVGLRLERKEHFQVFNGNEDEALQIAVAKNLHRRQLSAGEAAMVAAKLNISTAKAAAASNVGELSVKHAKRIRKHAAPHVTGFVERSLLTLADGLRISHLPMEIQNGLTSPQACKDYLASPAYRSANSGSLTRAMKDAERKINLAREMDIGAILSTGLTQAQASAILAVCDNGIEFLTAVRESILEGQP